MSKYAEELKAKVKMGENVFVAPNATLLGEITIGNHASVWYGAVLRADMDTITIGAGTNIQDGVIMHTDPLKPIVVGEQNTIGHGAVLHGCTIGNYSLIGIRATVLNGAKIGNGCIIGAHALVTEGMEVPDYSMVMGVPAKIVKQLPEAVVEKMKLGTMVYMQEALKYLEA